MSDLALTISPEAKEDADAVERLHERTFGPGRYAKTAYRLREEVAHRPDLSFTARIGTLLVGSVWLSPIRIGETKALLLGPLTVEPAFRERGIGQALIERALSEARNKGHKLVILVGDEPYYGKKPASKACRTAARPCLDRSILRAFWSLSLPKAPLTVCQVRYALNGIRKPRAIPLPLRYSAA
jgi:predicted N-acetyltransferase YhbS